MRSRWFWLPLVVVTSGLVACSNENEAPSGGGAAGQVPGRVTPRALTYSDDIAPILNDKCVRCHQEGGIGPFPLDNYEDAKKWSSAVVSVVNAGTMPPYYIHHDGTCGDFPSDEALTAEQKTKIESWTNGGTSEGTKRLFTKAPVPHLEGGQDFKTPLFAPEIQGGLLAAFDEYRCFPIEHGLTKDTFITGYDVLPGNPSLVHHALAFIVDPEKKAMNGKTNAEYLKELDDMSPDRAGWPCFGSVADGVSVEAVPVDWAPGQGIIRYPGNTGARLRKTDLLAVQIHYNLVDPASKGMADSTTIRLSFADTVARRLAFFLPDGFLDTLRAGKPEALAPGQTSAKYSWTKTAKELGLPDGLPFVDIVGVMPHMHERGRKLELRLQDGGGQDSCIAKVDRWDFGWQRTYFYQSSPRITPTSTVQVTCEYDTSGAAMPILPGWGTRNEMCLSVLLVALPPGL